MPIKKHLVFYRFINRLDQTYKICVCIHVYEIYFFTLYSKVRHIRSKIDKSLADFNLQSTYYWVFYFFIYHNCEIQFFG